MTKAKTIVKLMNYSRYGALQQLFLMDALSKTEGDLPQLAGETNEKRIARCIKIRPATIAEIETFANEVAATGRDAYVAACEKAGVTWVNPVQWFNCAVEAADELKRAA